MMIEVKNLTKRFSGRTAVDGISFQVQPGEVVGFLGPNGAGKSTTMRMLTGYLPPTSGSAAISGHDVFNDSMKARREIGFMPENVPLYEDMRVAEYLKFRAALKGVKIRQVRSSVERAMEYCGLDEVKKKMIGTLSPLLLAAEELGRPVYVELERNPAVKSESWFLKLREKYEPANRKAARESLENIVSRSTRPHRPVETKLKSLQRDDLYVDVKSHMEENLKPIGRETEVRDAKGHHSLSQNGRQNL